MSEIAEKIRAATAVIKDFPKKGVSFIDITTISRKPELYQEAIAAIEKQFNPDDYDVIVSPEARGFLLGPIMALDQSKPFIPIRNPKNLPRDMISTESTSEYADKPLAIHRADIAPGTRVLIVDDVLATCGTALAIIGLVRELEGVVVGVSALYDLPYVPKRIQLPVTTRAVVTYEEAPAAYLPQ